MNTITTDFSYTTLGVPRRPPGGFPAACGHQRRQVYPGSRQVLCHADTAPAAGEAISEVRSLCRGLDLPAPRL